MKSHSKQNIKARFIHLEYNSKWFLFVISSWKLQNPTPSLPESFSETLRRSFYFVGVAGFSGSLPPIETLRVFLIFWLPLWPSLGYLQTEEA